MSGIASGWNELPAALPPTAAEGPPPPLGAHALAKPVGAFPLQIRRKRDVFLHRRTLYGCPLGNQGETRSDLAMTALVARIACAASRQLL